MTNSSSQRSAVQVKTEVTSLTSGISKLSVSVDIHHQRQHQEERHQQQQQRCDDADNEMVMRTRLCSQFQPNNYSVIFGRLPNGDIPTQTVGNHRFRVTVDMFLGRYIKSTTEEDKRRAVIDVIKIIRSSGGQFVRYSSGCWWEVGDAVAMANVNAVFCEYVRRRRRGSSSTPHRQQQQPQQPQRQQHRSSKTGSLIRQLVTSHNHFTQSQQPIPSTLTPAQRFQQDAVLTGSRGLGCLIAHQRPHVLTPV